MNYTLSEIAKILNSSNKFVLSDNLITSVYIDSRQIYLPQNALFVAIQSNKNDGHKYIPDAYKKGVRNFLVQTLNDEIYFQDANYIVTDDAVRALQSLAAFHRKKFNISMIGITGSNGKTIVKEWLYFLLKDEYNICRSPRSFNSQIGVPLSVLNLNDTHTLGIFEAGISLPREMNVLESIIRPDIAVLTHFGNAHSEGFDNDEQKLNEKLKLFNRSKFNIVQRFHHPYLQQKKIDENTFCISEKSNDKFVVQKIIQKNKFTEINISVDYENYWFNIPQTDDASIKNAITCFATIYTLNKNLIHKIIQKFSELPVISLRMELKKARFQSLMINDYYNSDIDSFEIAMSYLHQYTYQKNKILILSDFEEIKNSDEVYAKVKNIINQQDLSKLILIGNEWNQYVNNIKPPFHHYQSTSDFLDNWKLHTTDFFNAIILMKGARKFEFERITHQLELKTHDTILEINIPALYHNLTYYKNLVGKHVKIMCMLKAYGYGSGSVELAYALQKFGVDCFAVAYADEGVELKQAGIQTPVMVMLPEVNSFTDIINYHLEPEIYSFEILDVFLKELERQGIQNYPIHLKIDTGMHRLGFLPDEMDRLIIVLQSNSLVKVKSIFSHLAASESDEHRQYTLQQIQRFKDISSYIEKILSVSAIKHICNSAAIRRFPQAHFDMVRIGIGMYGISDNQEELNHLQNVLTLKTKIAQIKSLKKGDTVGYSRKEILNKDGKIAIIPIGYADGFSRKSGNANFYVKYKNQFIKTIGNVCMDMTLLELNNVDAKVGDEIIIFDSIEDIKRMSQVSETIAYEILTSISQRVNRIYIYE